MRKFYLLSFLAALLLMVSGRANAETQSPYTVDFNTEFSTYLSDFKVAPGWGHIPSSYYNYDEWETMYPSYKYLSSGGVDNSGCLQAGPQSNLDAYGSSTTDLLVTPKVTGAVSIAVKKNSESGNIKFYKIIKTNGTYENNGEINVTLPELSTSAFATVTLPDQQNTYIGIWADDVTIDNFEAATADIVLTKAITINKVTLTSEGQPKTNAEGTFPVAFDVQLTNTGDAPIAVGDDGYSLSLVRGDGENAEVVKTVEPQEPLAVGEQKTFSVAADLSYATYGDRSSYSIKENMGGTTVYGYWISPKAHVPRLIVKGDYGQVVSGTVANFGRTNTEVTKSYTVVNDGAADLHITEVTVPEGFNVSLKAPLTLAPDQSAALDITMKTDVIGEKNDSVVIKGDDVSNFAINVRGLVLDPNKFFADFSDQKLPVGSIAESDWELKNSYNTDNGYVLAHTSSTNPSKFILPKMVVAEGDSLTFDASRQGSSSYLKIYYSTDRKNWTLAREITTDELPSETIGWSDDYEFGSFSLKEIPAGEYYVAFEAGYSIIDNLYGYKRAAVDHDVQLTGRLLPGFAMVNNPYKASLTVHNLNVKPESGYTASLYFDGKPVAQAEATEIASDGTAELPLSFVPHAEGTFKAFVKYESGNLELTTDTVNVTVNQEQASREVQVGTPDKTDSQGVLYTYYKNSESETIYTADMLGLKPGDKITGIAYKGYNTPDYSGDGTLTTNVAVWLENTDDTQYADPIGETPKSQLTEMFNGEYTFTVQGSESNTVKMLDIAFAQPFVYTGKNLRVVVQSVADGYKSIYYEVNSTDLTHSILKKSDYSIETAAYAAQSLPVAILSVANDPSSISGKVSDQNGKAIEGATVTLTSGDVIYSGTTDANGDYDLSVIQTGNTYTATFAAEGYQSVTREGLSFANGALTGVDVTLVSTSGVDAIGINNDAAAKKGIYTIDGRKLSNGNDASGLERGIYIIDGKKVAVK